MKILIKVSVTFLVIVLLASCNNPLAPKEEDGNFVITIGAGGNGRSVTDYPPVIPGGPAAPPGAPDLTELDFSVTFTPIPSGSPATFGAQGNPEIKGKLAQGDYVVTMEVKLGSVLYAQGCAIDNPVKIGSGTNTITIWVYSVDDAAMPVVRTRLQDKEYGLGDTATAMTVDVDTVSSGTLSYQWYSNTIRSNSGGTPIAGSMGASFTPGTSASGISYYYCVVTHNDPGVSVSQTTTAVTNAAQVTVRINAATPVISAHPAGAVYSPNTTPADLTVSAAVSDGGTLSYQWYRNTTANASGGTAVGNDSNSYTPDTASSGEFYYYCVVTNTITDNGDGGNKTAAATSNVAKVSVTSVASWTAETSTAITSINAIVYDGGQFVAGGYVSSNNPALVTSSYPQIVSSADGIAWTSISQVYGGGFAGGSADTIAYGGGKFVVGGCNTNNNYSYVPKISYSSVTDITSWTGAALNDIFYNGDKVNAIAYGGGKFIAGASKRIAYSTDGITWTAISDSTFGTFNINAIAYGSGKFIAGHSGQMAYSTDGITWTAVGDSTFGTSEIKAIAYGGGKFIAAGDSGKMAYSADGITWTAVSDSTFGTSTTINAIAYGNGKFIAGGDSGKMAYSADGGVTWTALNSTFGTSQIKAIAYGGGKFVAGGGDGKIAWAAED